MLPLLPDIVYCAWLSVSDLFVTLWHCTNMFWLIDYIYWLIVGVCWLPTSVKQVSNCFCNKKTVCLCPISRQSSWMSIFIFVWFPWYCVYWLAHKNSGTHVLYIVGAFEQFWKWSVVIFATEQPLLTLIIQKRRLMLFGHLIRMDESADARRILTAVPQSDWRRPVGRPYSSWMATLKNDLSLHNLTYEDSMEMALDKLLWRLLAASGATHWWCMPNNDDDDIFAVKSGPVERCV